MIAYSVFNAASPLQIYENAAGSDEARGHQGRRRRLREVSAFIAASLLRTYENTPREATKLEVIRDAAVNYAIQAIMEDRNQEPHKIFGV